MDLIKEMKKKILSVFDEDKQDVKREEDQPSSLDDVFKAEEKEKLSEYPSLRQSTPENRDISPY